LEKVLLPPPEEGVVGSSHERHRLCKKGSPATQKGFGVGRRSIHTRKRLSGKGEKKPTYFKSKDGKKV